MCCKVSPRTLQKRVLLTSMIIWLVTIKCRSVQHCEDSSVWAKLLFQSVRAGKNLGGRIGWLEINVIWSNIAMMSILLMHLLHNHICVKHLAVYTKVSAFKSHLSNLVKEVEPLLTEV